MPSLSNLFPVFDCLSSFLFFLCRRSSFSPLPLRISFACLHPYFLLTWIFCQCLVPILPLCPSLRHKHIPSGMCLCLIMAPVHLLVAGSLHLTACLLLLRLLPFLDHNAKSWHCVSEKALLFISMRLLCSLGVTRQRSCKKKKFNLAQPGSVCQSNSCMCTFLMTYIVKWIILLTLATITFIYIIVYYIWLQCLWVW